MYRCNHLFYMNIRCTLPKRGLKLPLGDDDMLGQMLMSHAPMRTSWNGCLGGVEEKTLTPQVPLPQHTHTHNDIVSL